VEDGELFLIRGRRGSLVPSHVMYACVLMIFFKITLANMNILKNCFDIYAQAPRQIINLSKSTIYTGSISQRWEHLITNLLSFSLGSIEASWHIICLF